jgi:hypothetical protein
VDLWIDVTCERKGNIFIWSLTHVRQHQHVDILAWLSELVSCDGLDGLSFQKHMKSGDRVRVGIKVRLWSRRITRYYGGECESGLEVLDCVMYSNVINDQTSQGERCWTKNCWSWRRN